MKLYAYETVPNNLEKHILEDSRKKFIPVTSYTSVNGCVDGYFYKKINMEKVKKRYNGNYINLLIEYYEKIKRLINCNELVEIFECNGEIYEISKLIDSKQILADNIQVSYNEIKSIFINALEGIDKLKASGDKTLGIDSAIWNYSKKGVFFDYDPPRILRADSLFIESAIDFKKRILYRNFNYTGMKANTLGTIFLGNQNWNFNVVDLSEIYVLELIDIFLSSITEAEEVEKLKEQIFGDDEVKEFSKHPIDIIRKQLKKTK